MPPSPRVVFLGFTAFEHSALTSAFRLHTHRSPRYEVVPGVAAAHFLVANADHATTVQAVLAAGRLAHTVFIGDQAPPAAAAVWMRRPIDPLHVMRELDRLTARSAPATATAAAAPLSALEPAPARRAPAASSAVSTAVQALLVDDSDIALRFLQKSLAPYAVQSECASGSAKAIELMAKHAYRFVFLDVELGPASAMDGLALCQHVKRQHHQPGAPLPLVVMVSAHHSELDRVRGSLAGCDAYLGKPLQPAELQHLMHRHGLRVAPA